MNMLMFYVFLSVVLKDILIVKEWCFVLRNYEWDYSLWIVFLSEMMRIFDFLYGSFLGCSFYCCDGDVWYLSGKFFILMMLGYFVGGGSSKYYSY